MRVVDQGGGGGIAIYEQDRGRRRHIPIKNLWEYPQGSMGVYRPTHGLSCIKFEHQNPWETFKKWVQNILASDFTNTKIFSLGWRGGWPSDQKYKSKSIETVSISQNKQLYTDWHANENNGREALF